MLTLSFRHYQGKAWQPCAGHNAFLSNAEVARRPRGRVGDKYSPPVLSKHQFMKTCALNRRWAGTADVAPWFVLTTDYNYLYLNTRWTKRDFLLSW